MKNNRIVESHFDDIEKVIIKELEKADYSIHVASAWFNSIKLLNELIKLLSNGLAVEIITSTKEDALGELDLSTFYSSGGTLLQVEVSTSNYGIMHNKYCIIDVSKVITGSYNWTNNANKSNENIVIIKDSKIASQYLENFQALRSLGVYPENYDSLKENGISIYFTSTKDLVDQNTDFQLFWDVKNADYIKLQDSQGFYSVQSLKDSLTKRISEDEVFTITAFQEDQEVTKTIAVKLLKEPIIIYEIQIYNPFDQSVLLNESIYKIQNDVYLAPIGSKIILSWEILNAETAYLNNEEISLVGKMELSPKELTKYKFTSKNIKHVKNHEFTLKMIQIPELKILKLPFPEDVRTEVKVKLTPVQVPGCFSLLGLNSSLQVPILSSLYHEINITEKSIKYLGDNLISEYREKIETNLKK
jgi:hypothetical protein